METLAAFAISLIVYAVPVKYNNQIVGALIETRDGNYLSELTNQIKIGETGSAFMIRKDGANIANADSDKVINQKIYLLFQKK